MPWYIAALFIGICVMLALGIICFIIGVRHGR